MGMCPELVEATLRSISYSCSRFLECGAVLAGVKAKPSGWPFAGSGPALTPAPGDAIKGRAGSRRGTGVEGI
jgi:hypothetical protein